MSERALMTSLEFDRMSCEPSRPRVVPEPAADIIPPVRLAPGANDPLTELVGRMVQRDEVALADLYERCVSAVYGIALRITRNRATAEEVTEDTFFQAWRDAARFDPQRGRPLTWLVTIARSRALDALRRGDPAHACEDIESLADQAHEGADPLDLLSACRADAGVHAALAELSPVQRQLIALAFFKGLSHSEIAEHCAMPLGTVKSHVRIGLARLRAALGEGFAPTGSSPAEPGRLSPYS